MDIVFTASAADVRRLDICLHERFSKYSRSRFTKLIRELTVNDKAAKFSQKLEDGDKVFCRVDEPEDAAEKDNSEFYKSIRIIHEDETFLVIDKPAGLAAHPPPYNEPTLAHFAARFLREDASNFAEPDRAGIVHRLDRETSGLVIIARTAAAAVEIQRQFQERTVHKVYQALVVGDIYKAGGVIDRPLERDPHRRMRRRVTQKEGAGREAVTEYHVAQRLKGHTLLEVVLHTGRTHQIRVHLAGEGHPVLGDHSYARNMKETFLHLAAVELVFAHPVTGEEIQFQTELPEPFKQTLARLQT